MTHLDNIKTIFSDDFRIKDRLRNNDVHNSSFLDLTLKSYEIISHMKKQDLSIIKSLKTNENVNLFDHQILAAQKIKNDLGGTGILADEVGLGKTVEAGIIMKEFLTTGLAKKILILAPPSLLFQWKDEMASKFRLDFTIYRNDMGFSDLLSNDLLIMSHPSAVNPNRAIALNELFWDMVVVDEAHSMKNSQTRKHNLVKNLPKRNLLLLTATPIQNNLEELYNLIELLHPGYLGTWNQFKDRYVLDKNSRAINPIFRKELQKILSTFVIRTTRKEVRKYIEFADRIPHTKILEPSEIESRLYDEITNIIRNLYSNNYDTLALMVYQRLASSSTSASKRALYKMKMNNIIDDQKYDEIMLLANNINIDSKLIDLLKIIKTDKSKFLVFTEFYATQNYLADVLVKNGHSVVLFNGKMNQEEKHDAINKFKKNVSVMISTSAGGEGQNFQFCHNVVNYDLPWNPMKVEQRIGRVHRIGQSNNVHIYNYALKDTIEAYILQLLYAKIKLFEMTLGELDLIFEDSLDYATSQTWFKEYMKSPSKSDAHNRFSALGNNWHDHKITVGNAIHDFNNKVFENFDLSALKENKIESN